MDRLCVQLIIIDIVAVMSTGKTESMEAWYLSSIFIEQQQPRSSLTAITVMNFTMILVARLCRGLSCTNETNRPAANRKLMQYL